MITIASREIITRALIEDLGQGDLTVDSLPQLQEQTSTAWICNRQPMILSGIDIAEEVFLQVDASIRFEALYSSGQFLEANTKIAKISGSTASLLKAERTALNFLQHLSGIATMTQAFVEQLKGTSASITHTRKTTPGLRILERQAVLDGGGMLHRFNLGSAVMLKDNHLTKISIQQAVAKIRQKVGHTVSIEVEADMLAQVEEALGAGADIIMLDNMSLDDIKTAVKQIAGRAKIEVSGNVSLETVRAYAEVGAQIISTSKITLGAPAVDIGLDFETA